MDLAVQRQADLDIPAVGSFRLSPEEIAALEPIQDRVESRGPQSGGVAYREDPLHRVRCSDRQSEGLGRRQSALVRDRVEPPRKRLECAVDRRVDKATRTILRPTLASQYRSIESARMSAKPYIRQHSCHLLGSLRKRMPKADAEIGCRSRNGAWLV
jgi:hypothetical protein